MISVAQFKQEVLDPLMTGIAPEKRRELYLVTKVSYIDDEVRIMGDLAEQTDVKSFFWAVCDIGHVQ